MTEKVSSSEKVPCQDKTCGGEHNAELNSCNEAPPIESEQATYASANNDLKGTKLYQEADVSGLYNLAMAIIDYRGHRVVAQVCTYTETAKSFIFRLYISSLCVFLKLAMCFMYVLECSPRHPSRR